MALSRRRFFGLLGALAASPVAKPLLALVPEAQPPIGFDVKLPQNFTQFKFEPKRYYMWIQLENPKTMFTLKGIQVPAADEGE